MWGIHIERTAAKAVVANIRIYSLFKIEFLDFNMKFTLYNALINSIDFYTCSTAAYKEDRSLLSSERAPHKNNTVSVKQE
jgi:hypothetical protein